MSARPLHTAGPWIADGVLVLRQSRPSDTTGIDRLVAIVYSNTKPGDDLNLSANGDLIAAAPDLLAAAQAAAQCIGELPPTQARVEAMQMLQVVIAKATGGKSCR